MPNWCYNRITVYGDSETEAKLKEIEKIFEKEEPFNDIFPIPDFKTIPREDGQLPVLKQEFNKDGKLIYETYNFPDGKNDDCLLYTSPSPRDKRQSRMPSSA